MLDTLRRIVQEVSVAPDLAAALHVVVARIRETLGADACAVYLVDKLARQYVLMATDGHNPRAVGNLRVPLNFGLIGLVGEREEPLNVDDAASHPRFRFFHDLAEEAFHAFLGVPIIHRREVVGVIVVRHRARKRFLEDEEALLITIGSQLAGAIAHAEASGDIDKLLAEQGIAEHAIDGIAGSPGVAIGTVMVAYPSADLDAVPDRRVEDCEAEVTVFLTAIEKTKADIQRLANELGQVAEADRALFDAYLMMLSSDSIVGRSIDRIRDGSWASGALRDTIREHERAFDNMDDPILRERASDVRDLGRRLLLTLQSGRRSAPPYPERTILIGEEITATMLAEVPRDRLAGVVSVRGSALSHVCILANALGVPAVVGVEDLPVSRLDYCEAVVDGYRGRLYLSPSSAVKQEYARLAREEAELEADLAELRDLPAVTTDGVRVPLYANTGLISDLVPSLSSGAEGIGLYRTEFPFMIRDRFPGEEEQRRTYRQILEAFAPNPVVVRTLDIGGDKGLSYFPITEENPFLGWRGIRVTLDHPEIFLVQIRALFKAARGLSNMKILLPMISRISEFDEAKSLIRRVYSELLAEGEPVSMPEVGMMVEVPSVIFTMERFASRADFFSIGTNDLTQYLLAVDRNNSRVASLYDSLHPAVVDAIARVVDVAQRHNRPVGVCGAMAGDPAAVLVLLGLGVSSFSMSASRLPKIKSIVRNFSAAETRRIVQHVLTLDNSQAIRDYLENLLRDAGLGRLVRVGR